MFVSWFDVFITNTVMSGNGVVERSHETGKPSSCVAGSVSVNSSDGSFELI